MSRTQPCKAFAPGSVGNLACGFDVLGMALEGPGDMVSATTHADPGVQIQAVHGDGGRLPRDVTRNAAGTAARAVLQMVDAHAGVVLELWKGLPLAAGMGGSAASAVAAAVAVDGVLGSGLPMEELLRCALAGERVAAGDAHPDNAAPSLLGGLVLVPPWEPLRIIELDVPDELMVAHVRPHLEVETRQAREVLGHQVPLKDAIAHWANTAALVTGLYRRDWALIGRAVEDRVAEPYRSRSVPGFDAVKKAALDAGALGVSLSGSGPSMFALCRGRERAEGVGGRMVQVFQDSAGLAADLTVSPGRAPGARIVSD